MRVERVGLGELLVDYRRVWDHQRALHAEVADGVREDTILLLEHASVYTAGKRTARSERPVDGTEVIDVDRGGRITWHGPGQLVVYPIVRLVPPVDVIAYVRALEDAVIALAGDVGVASVRVPGRSGVWIRDAAGGQDRKLASIGVRVARGVTMHGVAINACPDLTAFSAIVPCGIPDVGVTSLTAETGRVLTPLDIAPLAEHHLGRALAPLLRERVAERP
ncbi:lipoyl(octanoyl) transferase LipB [Georgenia faecalis]|uniref:Octanoyltransferase n=1 Tax=Georgenia faecalis TaxID=2483799 RepID=A0ABV9DAM8_9MICO|nr:lipoyl(octanoyl) transferase LipB [Georgenia faecalis]